MNVLGRTARRLNGQPYLLLALASLGWACNTVAGRLAVGEVSPMAVVTLRWLVVVGVLAVVARRPLRTDWSALRPRWRYLLAMGALGYTAFNALFYWAAYHTSAVNMGVLQGIAPVAILVISFLVYRTPVGLLQTLGLVITIVGVAVVTSRGDLQVLKAFAFNVGDLGVAAAAVLYAGYTVGLRERPQVAPMSFFAALAGAAFLSSLPLLAAEAALGTLHWPSPLGVALVLFIALVPSLASQLCYMRGVELIGPSRAGLFMNLVPILGPILAVLILGEDFHLYHAAALLLVLAGIWLAERRALPSPAPPIRT